MYMLHIVMLKPHIHRSLSTLVYILRANGLYIPGCIRVPCCVRDCHIHTSLHDVVWPADVTKMQTALAWSIFSGYMYSRPSVYSDIMIRAYCCCFVCVCFIFVVVFILKRPTLKKKLAWELGWFLIRPPIFIKIYRPIFLRSA